jgi:hypothetical protein
MSTEHDALIDHPPADAEPPPSHRFTVEVMDACRRQPAPRRVRWWPWCSLLALAGLALPGLPEGAVDFAPVEGFELAVCAGILLLVLALSGQGREAARKENLQ